MGRYVNPGNEGFAKILRSRYVDKTGLISVFDPYIESLYMLSEPSVADVICEVACISNSFFLALAQSFGSDAFLEVFLNELLSTGIDYEVVRKEPFCLCGMEPVKLA